MELEHFDDILQLVQASCSLTEWVVTRTTRREYHILAKTMVIVENIRQVVVRFQTFLFLTVQYLAFTVLTIRELIQLLHKVHKNPKKEHSLEFGATFFQGLSSFSENMSLLSDCGFTLTKSQDFW
eukprot:TRINITY_DN6081_c0_g1_i3.p1 TRINITY_DN6081_c0_g1~~TRINITY_DN6081_c0_g1_i3.p1  ORF type:complete len:147 (-),score=17.16 TRINITY_DN6081_c0_g1_i3:510-884(-)